MSKKAIRLGTLLLTAALSASAFAGCAKKAEVASLPQFDQEIKQGEKIAVMTIRDYGQIKIRFFPDEAPKAVENFIELAEEGFYDELNFHRVIKDFMIQGGDAKGDGTGKHSIYGEDGFELEINDDLCHFRGALSMANSGPDSNGSQFFIVQNSTRYTDEQLDQAEAYRKQMTGQYGLDYTMLADKVREKYKEVGGYPSLDGCYTVFGQVFEGMDVVDEIAGCKVKSVTTSSGQSEASKPVEEVLIEKVEIVEYQG